MSEKYEYKFVCKTDRELAKAVGVLLGCHQHNFEVVRSDPDDKGVLFSSMAVECLSKHHNYIIRDEEED